MPTMTPAEIERAVIRGLPYLSCSAANAEVVRLTLLVIRLQYELGMVRKKPVEFWDEPPA